MSDEYDPARDPSNYTHTCTGNDGEAATCSDAPLLRDLRQLEADVRGENWLFGNDPAIMGLLLILIEEVRGLRADVAEKEPETQGEVLARACRNS